MLRPSMAAAALALTALLGPNPTAVLAAPVADAPAAKEVAEGPDAASLRAAELAFAASVAAHDPERFALFIADDAIFIGGGALRGRAAIVAAWAGFFADGGPKIEWAPRLVEVQDGGALGLTRGPYTRDPAGRRRRRQSVLGHLHVDLAARARRPLARHLRRRLPALPAVRRRRRLTGSPPAQSRRPALLRGEPISHRHRTSNPAGRHDGP